MSKLDRWLSLDLSQVSCAATSATSATSKTNGRTTVCVVPACSGPFATSEPVEFPRSGADVADVASVAGSSVRIPAEWADGIDRLRKIGVVHWSSRGRQLLQDAQAFLPRWGAQAAALGWGTLDLFGSHAVAPFARYDLMGLVIVLEGAEVIAMTSEHAEIRTRSGARQRYFRRPADEGQVPIWALRIGD